MGGIANGDFVFAAIAIKTALIIAPARAIGGATATVLAAANGVGFAKWAAVGICVQIVPGTGGQGSDKRKRKKYGF